MFQYLPVEIIQAIVADVTDLDDLASLSRVSRLLNAQTTPLLYKHTVLDIRAATYAPYATGYTERRRAQLHGLALNTQNQCQNITTLTVKNSHPQNNSNIFWRNARMPPDDGQSLSHAEKNPFLSLVCSMVEIALRQMPRLDEFAPDLSILRNSSLASLSIMNIACDKAADDLASLIFSNRHSLRSLRLGFRIWEWRRSLDIDTDSLTDEERYAYMDSWANDQFLPILRDIVETGNPLNLLTLEIHRVDRFNVPRLLQAFCFQTIQKFALIDTYFDPWNDETKELWRSLKDQQVSFQYLVTDAPNWELVDFVGSFQGLEGLLLYIQAIIDGCPKLEEFGWGMCEEDLNDILRIISGASTLRSIYVVSCLKRGSLFSEQQQRGERLDFLPNEFLHYFVNYYRHNPSIFYDNLDKVSYSRILWDLVPTDLSQEEQEEMEYELMSEGVSSSELEDLRLDESMEVDIENIGIPDTSASGQDELPTFPTSSDLFSWETSMTELEKMPVRVSWSSHSDSTMVNAVRFYVMKPTWGDQWDVEDPVQDECICGDPDFGEETCRTCHEVPENAADLRIIPHCPVLFPA
ncbi:hypothetical protein CNMCM5793_004787 [Aspergillus hiratsukae]|uniref:F-box domain-containing protein n=1 Tax=Aspergillus hiratsukae TaxID=1194566 RepID=A0A8H6UCV7_9EURO|nr:hypothetical protein CNMCM5793_004787 [Aspergillus hiratsukae]